MDEKKVVKLNPLNIGTIKIKIRGTSPLLMSKFPDKTRQAIIEKQSTGVKKVKELRNLNEEVELAKHKTADGHIGFPAEGFKGGMLEAVSIASGSIKLFNRKHVAGVQIVNTQDGLVPIQFDKEDVFIHNVGSQTLLTPRFYNWSCELAIMFDKNVISAEDIVNLLRYAGFHVGIGMWRPKCRDGGSGSFGMYEVV